MRRYEMRYALLPDFPVGKEIILEASASDAFGQRKLRIQFPDEAEAS